MKEKEKFLKLETKLNNMFGLEGDYRRSAATDSWFC